MPPEIPCVVKREREMRERDIEEEKEVMNEWLRERNENKERER
jgi:hypothetical protein